MAINRKQTVDIVEDLVTLINTELTGTSAWVDNGDGTYTIALCNTYWLNTMETVTIDSVEFTDLVVIKDTSLTVTGASIPTELTFFLDVPSYYHGTVIQTNEEITASNPNVTARTPMVYLLEIISDDFKSDEDSLERTSDLRLFFLTEADEKNWETDDHYTDAIVPMRKMVNFFVDEVLKKNKGLGKIEEYTVTNHANFGVYTTDRGHTNKIFNDSYSGCELRITLPIKEDMSCGCDGVFSKIKYVDSDATIQSSDYGSTIVCTPSVCDDGTVNVNKSDSTLISAETVTSGGTTNYNVGDSTVKSTGTVYTSTVKATETFTIPDVSWTDSDSTPQTSEYGSAITCAAPAGEHSSEIFKTGQTVSYATGDDGDLELGNGTDFYTLGYNNGFGTTNRFTLKDGTALTSTNFFGDGTVVDGQSIFVDWSTWDRVNDTVLLYRCGYISGTWAATITSANTAPSGEPATGWHLTNFKELSNVCDFNGNVSGRLILSYFKNYEVSTQDWFTSTTQISSSANAYYISNNVTFNIRGKTNSHGGVQCRYYTLAELGL